MDREQIQRDGEKAVLTAWDRALTRPSETAVDTVQARLAVVAAQAPLLAAIDELEVRNAKLEAVAVFMKKRGRKVSDCEAVKTTYVDRRPRFRYCGRCPMCKVWAALDALDD